MSLLLYPTWHFPPLIDWLIYRSYKEDVLPCSAYWGGPATKDKRTLLQRYNYIYIYTVTLIALVCGKNILWNSVKLMKSENT